jgi:hypothetical protein
MGIHPETKDVAFAGNLPARWRIAFLVGMILLLALMEWLGLSGKAHVWIVKLVSARFGYSLTLYPYLRCWL